MFCLGVPFPLHSDHSMSEAKSQESRFCAPKRLVPSQQDAEKQEPEKTREGLGMAGAETTYSIFLRLILLYQKPSPTKNVINA